MSVVKADSEGWTVFLGRRRVDRVPRQRRVDRVPPAISSTIDGVLVSTHSKNVTIRKLTILPLVLSYIL